MTIVPFGTQLLTEAYKQIGVSPPWVRIPPSPPEFRRVIAFIELEVTRIPR